MPSAPAQDGARRTSARAPAAPRVARQPARRSGPGSGSAPTGWRAPTSRCGRAGPRPSSCVCSTTTAARDPPPADRADPRDLARLRARRAARASATATGCTAAGTPGPAPAGTRRSCCSTRTPGRWTATSTPAAAEVYGHVRDWPQQQVADTVRDDRDSAPYVPKGVVVHDDDPTTMGGRPPARRRRGRTRSSTSCTCAASPCGTRASRRSCAARTRGWRTRRRSSTSSGSA